MKKAFLAGVCSLIAIILSAGQVLAESTTVIQDTFDLQQSAFLNENYDSRDVDSIPSDIWVQEGSTLLPTSYKIANKSGHDNYLKIAHTNAIPANCDLTAIKHNLSSNVTGLVDVSADLKMYYAHNSNDNEWPEFKVMDTVNNYNICSLRLVCKTSGVTDVIISDQAAWTYPDDFTNSFIGNDTFFKVRVLVDTVKKAYRLSVNGTVIREFTYTSANYSPSMSVGAVEIRSKMYPGNSMGIDNLNISQATGAIPEGWGAGATKPMPSYNLINAPLSASASLNAWVKDGTQEFELIRNVGSAVNSPLIEVSSKIKFRTNGSGENAYAYFGLLGSDETNDICRIMINNDNRVTSSSLPRVYVISGSNWYPHPIASSAVQNDTYVPVKITLDTVNKKFMTEINGVKDSSWRSTNSAAGTAVEKIRFRINSNWGTTNINNFYLDDLLLRSSGDIFLNIKDASGIDIHNGVLSGGTVNATVTATNGGSQGRPVSVILAFYNNGILEDMSVQKMTIPANSTNPVTVSAQMNVVDSAGHKIRAYVWDDINTMKPLLMPQVLNSVQ